MVVIQLIFKMCICNCTHLCDLYNTVCDVTLCQAFLKVTKLLNEEH